MDEQQNSRTINLGKISLILIVLVLVFRFYAASLIESWIYSLFYQEINCTSFGSCSFSLYDTIRKAIEMMLNLMPILALVLGIISLFKQTGRGRLYGEMGIFLSIGWMIYMWLVISVAIHSL